MRFFTLLIKIDVKIYTLCHYGNQHFSTSYINSVFELCNNSAQRLVYEEDAENAAIVLYLRRSFHRRVHEQFFAFLSSIVDCLDYPAFL